MPGRGASERMDTTALDKARLSAWASINARCSWCVSHRFRQAETVPRCTIELLGHFGNAHPLTAQKDDAGTFGMVLLAGMALDKLF